jgi:hypothetical protein
MPFPVVPIVVVGLAGGALWRVKRVKYGVMTPDRKKVFEDNLKSQKDPIKLRTLADAYQKMGLKTEATELRKRAALREAPESLKKQRAAAFQKAISSSDPAKVHTVANAFHLIGAYEAASKLRNYARNLVAGTPQDPPIGPGGLPPT